MMFFTPASLPASLPKIFALNRKGVDDIRFGGADKEEE